MGRRFAGAMLSCGDRLGERSGSCRGDRCRIVVGDAARLSDLAGRMRSQSSRSPSAISRRRRRQARLALDRRERSVTGPRYKVPRDVKDQMVSGRRSRTGCGARRAAGPAIGGGPGRGAGYSRRWRARRARSFASCGRGGREPCTRARRALLRRRRDRATAEVGRSHRSCFSRRQVQSRRLRAGVASLREGIPPNHTLGGINMAFWRWGRSAGASA